MIEFVGKSFKQNLYEEVQQGSFDHNTVIPNPLSFSSILCFLRGSWLGDSRSRYLEGQGDCVNTCNCYGAYNSPSSP